MDTPGWLGSLFAVATVAWGVAGTLHTNRMLAPVREATARGRHQLELARSSRDVFTRKAFLTKARASANAHNDVPARWRRWHNRLYLPGCLVLAAGTVVCAVWEVTA